MNKSIVISHRGNFLPEGPIPEVQNKYEIPENTIEAFDRAFKNGWGIETDIRILGDGSFAVIHDTDIVRFSGKPDLIDRIAASQVKEVGYKNNPRFKIPILDDLCLLSQKYTKEGKAPFIAFQIKRGRVPGSGVAVGRGIAKSMDHYGLKDSIIFDATFEEAQVLRDEFPWFNLSISVGEKNYVPTIYTPEQALSQKFLEVFNCVWADEWKKSGSIYTKEMLMRFRAAFKGRIDVISPELHYNENHPLAKDIEGLEKLWKEIISWGIVDGVCTDYPSKLQDCLSSY